MAGGQAAGHGPGGAAGPGGALVVVRTVRGIRAGGTAGWAGLGLLGVGLGVVPDPQGGGWWQSMVLVVLGLASLVRAARTWSAGVRVRDGQVVAREVFGTRRIPVDMVTGIDAVQSGWLPFWTLRVATARGTVVVRDVRDVPGPSGQARMRHAAAVLQAQVRAATADGLRGPAS